MLDHYHDDISMMTRLILCVVDLQKKSAKSKDKRWEANLAGTKKVVVLNEQEKKVYTLLQQLNTVRNEKTAKRKEQRRKKLKEFAKKQERTEAFFAPNKKAERKRKFRAEGLKQNKRSRV